MAKITKKRDIIVKVIVIAATLFLIYFPVFYIFEMVGRTIGINLGSGSGLYDQKLFIWSTVLAIGAILTQLKILSLATNFKYFMVLVAIVSVIFLEVLILTIFSHALDFMLMVIFTGKFCRGYSEWMPSGAAKGVSETCGFLRTTVHLW